MNRLLSTLSAIAAFSVSAAAQSIPSPGEMARTTPPPPAASASPSPAAPAPASTTKGNHATPADSQAIIDRLTRTNADLLDLLNRQQDVLKDIQYDRRIQNRQISLIEQRLEDTLQLNAKLEEKIGKLEAAAAFAASSPAPVANSQGAQAAPAKVAQPSAPPAPPPTASYLPAEQTEGASGTMWWHRLLALSGNDAKTSDIFHISGKQWRVLWHNEDKPGDVYKNTSALFISAFPARDTVPKKVCSQLGSGGNSTELVGTGDYYLKVEASGGHWELAVEDFH